MAAELKDDISAEKLRCINELEGKFLVLAGPGTGKTFTISKRIENMISQGYASERILCLTYTEAAALQMENKIRDEIREAGHNPNIDFNIYTFHGFCMNIIKNHQDKFEMDNIKIITDSVARIFVKECLDEDKENAKNFITSTGNKYWYIPSILKAIEDIKKYNLTEDKYFDNLRNSDIDPDSDKYKRLVSLWKIYELYKKKMQTKKYIDFADMIIKVIESFKDEAFLQEIADEFDFIIVDEYQDTNPVQNEIIFNLGKYCPNIMVVGDDDQTIYSFQGARISTMKEYIEHFNIDDDKVICLTENRRSTQNIIDVSREAARLQQYYYKKYIYDVICKNDKQKSIAQDYEQIYVPLETDREFVKYKITKDLKSTDCKFENETVKLTQYKDEVQENNDIIKQIKTLIKQEKFPKINGEPDLSQIAILAPKNKYLEPFEDLLKRNNIKYELKDGKNIFELNAVNVLIYYLHLLVNPDVYSDKFLTYLLSRPFNIEPEDYITICQKKSHYKNLIETMTGKKVKDQNGKETLQREFFKNVYKIDNFLKVYNDLKTPKEGETIRDIILAALSATGILEEYSQNDAGAIDNLLGLKKFIDEAQAYVDFYRDLGKAPTLADFLNYISELEDDDVRINAEKPDYTNNAIQLVTYHSSKGREFEYVFMPALGNYNWEKQNEMNNKISVPLNDNKKIRTKMELAQNKYEHAWIKSEAKFMEKAKLIFVGMTRAKHGLYLSYLEPESNLSYFIKYINEIYGNNKNVIEFKNKVEEYSQEENLLNTLTTVLYDYEKDFCGLVDFRVKNKTFSPTYLNKALGCRKKYFFEVILGLTSKIDEADNANYGSSIHYALDKMVKYVVEENNNTLPSKETLIKWFEEKFTTLPFADIEKFLEQGRKNLSSFYDEMLSATDINNFYKSEEKITDYQINNENFAGTIDRIDKDNDGNYIIYDYKTGKHKTEKEICPNGKHFDYYNQMAFYKYILHDKYNIDYDKIKTIFIFPDYNKTTEINLSEYDCEKVKDKYLNVLSKIKNYDFDKKATDDDTLEDKEPSGENTCKYCPNKKFCAMNFIGKRG